MWAARQRTYLVLLVGTGLLLAAVAYLVPFSATAKAAIAWTFIAVGMLSVVFLVWRALASSTSTQRWDNMWGAVSVGLNTAIIALLLAEELGWALVASAVSAALMAVEHRGRRSAAGRP